MRRRVPQIASHVTSRSAKCAGGANACAFRRSSNTQLIASRTSMSSAAAPHAIRIRAAHVPPAISTGNCGHRVGVSPSPATNSTGFEAKVAAGPSIAGALSITGAHSIALSECPGRNATGSSTTTASTAHQIAYRVAAFNMRRGAILNASHAAAVTIDPSTAPFTNAARIRAVMISPPGSAAAAVSAPRNRSSFLR